MDSREAKSSCEHRIEAGGQGGEAGEQVVGPHGAQGGFGHAVKTLATAAGGGFCSPLLLYGCGHMIVLQYLDGGVGLE